MFEKKRTSQAALQGVRAAAELALVLFGVGLGPVAVLPLGTVAVLDLVGTVPVGVGWDLAGSADTWGSLARFPAYTCTYLLACSRTETFDCYNSVLHFGQAAEDNFLVRAEHFHRGKEMNSAEVQTDYLEKIRN